MSAIPKTSVIPPDGFHFIEKHDGKELKIESTSVPAVSEMLLRYRVNNKLPIGNPQQEVIDYICNTWPHFCTEGREPYLTPVRGIRREEHLSRRVSEWMVRLWEIGPNEIPQAEAERRAAICAACPSNQDFHAGACGPCVESLEQLSFVWLRGRTTLVQEKLFGCRACGSANKAAVHADKLPPLTPEDSAALDPSCWRR